MRLLVLGGSAFLSRAVAADAVARGHEVVCACRGTSGAVPAGAEHVAWDRGAPPPPDLVARAFDAVVDVARQPSWVRAAVAAWPDAHWGFVSTINVYADEATPGQTPATGALREARHDDADLAADPEAYGALKVGCEEAVRAGAAAAFVVRPGLIVGPGDPTGRFTSWPARLARAAAESVGDGPGDGPGDGAGVLAGGSPDDAVQVIDVRDLAAWIVTAAETGLVGDYDGVGPVLTAGELVAAVARAVGAEVPVTWVASEELARHDVTPWSGPRSLPLWLPRPAYDGMLAHDAAPSLAAGLRVRPLADTARDTLAWLRAHPGAEVTGLTRPEELEVLAAVRARA